MKRWGWCLALSLWACGGEEEPPADGGTTPSDSGQGRVDLGVDTGLPPTDTGVTVDAGSEDLGTDAGPTDTGPPPDGIPPLVFVSRQIQDQGSIYWDEVKDLPGVGAHSRVRPAAPGSLLVREPDGTIRTLIDGADPSGNTFQLIDVNGPAVSYDGATIVFAGLPDGAYDDAPARTVGAWRLFLIDADGRNLRQLTFSDQQLNYDQFGPAAGGLQGYDDYDPVFLPDGRVVFSSTRYPSYGQYSGVRASQLYLVRTDGSGLRRITSERNGADRPLIDPLTGKIVYARWWRNHRFPAADLSTVWVDAGDPSRGYVQHLGLTADRNGPVGGDSMFRNAWQAAAINPDGTGLEMWTGIFRNEAANHVYGGAFNERGELYANFFPMYNMTEASGFGGIRRYVRGPTEGAYQSIIGVTDVTLDYVHPADPTSYGIFNGSYAAEPEVLPDGRLVIAYAADVQQDYGLQLIDADGSNREVLYDRPGTSELRARVLAARQAPPQADDRFRGVPNAPVPPLLPPTEAGPYAIGGTFIFNALNIYGNAPVDTAVVSAPAVGSAATIRFFADHQRTSPGSFPNLDWPILLGERVISAAGSVTEPVAPAWTPLFEQLRGPEPERRVPLTGGPEPDGAGHVTGMNYGTPVTVARCIGCHAGHTMIELPASDSDALWSNLAPGASVRVSSSHDARYDTGLIDRRVQKGEIWRYWRSAAGQATNQWVELVFPVPIEVRVVRLYNPRQGDEANCTLQVAAATVRLYEDEAATLEVGSMPATTLSVAGTDVLFADVRARVVRVELDQVAGTFYGEQVAALAEIEVIAKGAEP